MKNSRQGFTLVELMIVAAILAVVVVGMLKIFIFSSESAAIAADKTLALSAAQDKIEEIRNHSFDDIVADYAAGGTPGNAFTVSNLTSSGVVYIDSTNAELLIVKAVVCWEDKYGRIIGEDANLNGALDAGEDTPGEENNEIDSIASLVSMVAKR
ncbi:MAG: prepilin-type N-terminal cleavage/methylation domain-containing protein [Candidatus Aceula meridiana]|nr:prepilin-type N-terminal cleavage/methylation domain-containing protein [Candidatus Aceula meridiana]